MTALPLRHDGQRQDHERFGSDVMASRSGLRKQVDRLLEPDTALAPADFEGLDCVLVDEAQFLSPHVMPVICYGLRNRQRTAIRPMMWLPAAWRSCRLSSSTRWTRLRSVKPRLTWQTLV